MKKSGLNDTSRPKSLLKYEQGAKGIIENIRKAQELNEQMLEAARQQVEALKKVALTLLVFLSSIIFSLWQYSKLKKTGPTQPRRKQRRKKGKRKRLKLSSRPKSKLSSKSLLRSFDKRKFKQIAKNRLCAV